MPESKLNLWGGRILTALPVLMLCFSAVGKFTGSPQLEEGFKHLGWPMDLAYPLGILEVAVTVAYVVPRTSVLGAILITGYLGGAMATHVRIHEPWYTQFLLGVMVWGGLYFRDARIRNLIPIFKAAE